MSPTILAFAAILLCGCAETPADSQRPAQLPTRNVAPGIMPPDAVPAIASAAAAILDAGLTPGLTIAITAGDSVVHAAGFGVADVRTGRAVLPETPFYIASTTKSFTALAAAIAIQRGELDADAPVSHYLPAARFARAGAGDAITVRHLITLTHGLSGNGPVVTRTAYSGEFTRSELLELLRYHEDSGRRGTFAYDNLGYNLLGMVLERVYGGSWQDVVHRLVIAPVGMPGTSARLSTMDRATIAEPHWMHPDGWTALELLKDDANMHAAGGHFASAIDLARYVAAHASGGLVNGTRVLPEAAIAETQRLHVAQDREFGPFHRHAWGFGWDIGTYGGDTLIHRFGAFDGYRSHVSFMPQHDFGVVVLVNGDGPASAAADLLATHVYDLLLAKPEATRGFPARMDSLTVRLADYRESLTRHLAERAARDAPLRHPLRDFEGTYHNPLFGHVEFSSVDGRLFARAGVARSRAEVYDADDDALRVELFGSGQVADFDFPRRGGPATGFTLAEQEFRRVR